ncbi:MAG: type III-B CRISPR module-associated protein Cmr5 [Cystobacterineae bacterium]|nr:type III-B CRISPR module-associated protein Cmr5 [Cystobacterineae bacterium]
MQTRQQQWVQAAFKQVEEFVAPYRNQGKLPKELPVALSNYRSFALSFPALIHTCGLAQAIAFAKYKSEPLLEHLEGILHTDGQLADLSRTVPLQHYMLLSQQTLDAACWLKRYAEALIPVEREQ